MRTSFCCAIHHDYHLFKQNTLSIDPLTVLFADLGYLGIDALHASALISHKASKLKKKLTTEQKRENPSRENNALSLSKFLPLSHALKYFLPRTETGENVSAYDLTFGLQSLISDPLFPDF